MFSFRLSEQKGFLTLAFSWVWRWAGDPDVPQCLSAASSLGSSPYSFHFHTQRNPSSVLAVDDFWGKTLNQVDLNPEVHSDFPSVFLKWINSANRAHMHGKISYLLKDKVCEIEVSGQITQLWSQLHTHGSTVNLLKEASNLIKTNNLIILQLCPGVSSQAKTT